MKRFAHITDIHLEEEFSTENGVDPKKNWERILADLKEKNITNVVFGGDIGSAKAHGYFFNSIKHFENFYLVPGNHDKFDEIKKFYDVSASGSAVELFYIREEGNYKIIFLDTSTENFSEAQQEWLRNQLSTEKKIIIFIHHPVLKTGFAVDNKYPLGNREALKEILQNSGKEINIFCGHLHLQDKRNEGNITQHVTIASGFQSLKISDEIIFDTGIFGYRIIELDQSIRTSIVAFDKME